MSVFTGQFADLKEVTLHYLTAGQGEALVLLHGIPQTSFEWRFILPKLAEKYLVVAPDLRGLGDSTRPVSGYDKKTVAEDVWQLVHDHLGVTRFHLVGHDWGGPVAFSLAAHHPEAVSRLAILDVTIPGDGAEMSQGGRRWHHPFYRTPDLPEALCAGREELMMNWFFENYGHRANCISEEDKQEYYRTYKKLGAFRAMFAYYRAFAQDAADNREVLERNGKLTMPVLALGGDKAFGRGLETLDSLKRVAANVRGGIIPNCGHWVAEEQPEFVLQALLKFFAEKG
ncbi:alpha/beta hydrolase [Bradyrhizobium sp. CNPSo 4010]|uniref:Alpha/beta hydrolase n=1 Tax=Bradyrhizobium agreste TaxID=2751811 RepID=A0ABS0PKX8_9BRAD|nr:alpha/beta hydrolase [Bradyrhizobium agreste]MBH5397808.1 alpha/beta hydrolase [Bradyrhizobium agreste]